MAANERWQDEILQEIAEEFQHPAWERFGKVVFVSRSKGRNNCGRKIIRKTPEIIVLLTYNGKCYQMNNVYTPAKRLHVIAQEILTGILPHYDISWERFLEIFNEKPPRTNIG